MIPPPYYLTPDFDICWAFNLVINALIAMWMFYDAEKRGKTGVLWGIFGFFFGLIGLLIWVVVRPDKEVSYSPYYPYEYPPRYQQNYTEAGKEDRYYAPPPEAPKEPPEWGWNSTVV